MRSMLTQLQSTPVISRQLGAKICERELSGSPVISRENSQLPGSESHTVTSAPLKPKQYDEWWWVYLHFVDLCRRRHRTSNKPYHILIIMHQKLSNYTLHKAAYDGICAETIQTTMRFDRKRK